MFELSFEKLLLVAVLAALILGPQRLPTYTAKLARFVRSLRQLLDAAKQNAEADLGIPLDKNAYQVDLRQYDPRTIIRNTLHERTAPLPDLVPDDAEPPGRHPTDATSSTPAPERLAPTTPESRAPASTPGGAATDGSTDAEIAFLREEGKSEESNLAQFDAAPAPAVVRRWVVTGGSSGHPRRVLVTDPAVTASADR